MHPLLLVRRGVRMRDLAEILTHLSMSEKKRPLACLISGDTLDISAHTTTYLRTPRVALLHRTSTFDLAPLIFV